LNHNRLILLVIASKTQFTANKDEKSLLLPHVPGGKKI